MLKIKVSLKWAWFVLACIALVYIAVLTRYEYRCEMSELGICIVIDRWTHEIKLQPVKS